MNLALLIHTEHQGLLRRIQIKPDHIGQLLQKTSISRQFETLHPVRLEIVTTPDVADGGLADLLVLRHRTTAPLRHPFWLGLKRGIYDGLNLVGTKGGLTSATWRHFPQAIDTLLRKARSPQHDGLAIDLQFPSDGPIGPAGGCGQHDPASQRHLLGVPCAASQRSISSRSLVLNENTGSLDGMLQLTLTVLRLSSYLLDTTLVWFGFLCSDS